MTRAELKLELHSAAIELLEAADSEEHPAFQEYLRVCVQLRELDGARLQ